MADVKHTPGPWIIDPVHFHEVQTTNYQTIATCWCDGDEGQDLTICGTLDCTVEEAAANARLIAAAPETAAERDRLKARVEELEGVNADQAKALHAYMDQRDGLFDRVVELKAALNFYAAPATYERRAKGSDAARDGGQIARAALQSTQQSEGG